MTLFSLLCALKRANCSLPGRVQIGLEGDLQHLYLALIAQWAQKGSANCARADPLFGCMV
jgi:hypothetical protein